MIEALCRFPGDMKLLYNKKTRKGVDYMRKKNKMLALFLAVIMAVSTMTGCGNTQKKIEEKSQEVSEASKTSESAEKAESSVSASTEEVAEGPQMILPIVDEPITLKVAMPVSPKVEDINTNELTLYIEEVTGIDLEIIELSTTDQATQVNAIMNGGDLPDIFLSYKFEYPTLCSYAEAGLLAPMDEYIDKWGYNLQNNLLSNPLYEDALVWSSYDGHVYAMPNAGAGVNDYMGHFLPRIQAHFLEELGEELPTTLDGLRDFLRKVKEKYPDVIPWTTYSTNNYIFSNISQAYQYTNKGNYCKVNNGKIEFIANNDLFKEAIEYTKAMVDEGLIDKQSFTQDKSVLSTVLAQDGYNAAVLGCGYNVSQILDAAGDEYKNLDIIGVLEGPYGYKSTQVDLSATAINTAMAITTACKYPEEAFRLFDFFLSYEFAMKARVGSEGAQWEKSADGAVGRDGEQAWFKMLGTPEWSAPATNVIWARVNFTMTDVMNHCEMDPTTSNYLTGQRYIEQGLFELDTNEATPNFLMSTEDYAEYLELLNLIVGHVNTNVSKFILGERSLDEWDAYCAEIEAMGLDRFLELSQNSYDSMQE